MKVATHVILQIAALILQVGAVVTNVVPEKAKPFVVLVISAAQGGLAWYNHYYTPSGTPAPQA